MRRFSPAIFLSLLILVIAPGIGKIRDLLFVLFPGQAVRILAFGLALVGLAAALVVGRRIRRRRAARYGALGAAVALVAIKVLGLGTGQARVDVVETIHLLEYGGLAFLLYLALRRRGSASDDEIVDDPSLFLLPFLGAGGVGVLDEAVQWVAPLRVGEIRDVGINLFAAAVGLCMAFAWEPPERWTWRLGPSARRRVARAAALVLLVGGLFFAHAQLGHEIDDPAIGRFISRYSAAELVELSSIRARAWANDPPRELPIWGVEDPYLTEAAWHANHRNASERDGDVYRAWQANRILETYYAPFLDLESFRGSGVHRWSAEHRREIETRVPKRDPAGYKSPVLVGRIFPKPSHGAFLAGLFAVVAGLWCLGGGLWCLGGGLWCLGGGRATRPE